MIAMNSPISCEILYINLAWGDYISVDSITLSWSIELEGCLCFFIQAKGMLFQAATSWKKCRHFVRIKAALWSFGTKINASIINPILSIQQGGSGWTQHIFGTNKNMVALASNGCRPIFILALVWSNCLVDVSQAFAEKNAFFSCDGVS